MRSKILVIEDSQDAFQLVSRHLGTMAELKWAKSAREASMQLEKTEFDLILLDVHLPDGDGMQICSLITSNPSLAKTPVIMLTARNSPGDKVLGFSIGADDYITKPYEPLELRARVEARLRRKALYARESERVVAGPLEIDKQTQIATVNENGEDKVLDLTPIEFKILMLIARSPNVVHSRDEILNTVWGQNIHVYSRSVDTHVSKLRRKLGQYGDLVQSVHGIGYRFVAPERSEKIELATTISSSNQQQGLPRAANM